MVLMLIDAELVFANRFSKQPQGKHVTGLEHS